MRSPEHPQGPRETRRRAARGIERLGGERPAGPRGRHPVRAAATPDHRRERLAEGRASILVVDDDHASLKLLRVLLQGEGYEVRAVSDAELALLAVRESVPRLVVTDLYMPGMGAGRGWAARSIRPIRSDTFAPVIMTMIGPDPQPAMPARPTR